MKRKITALLLVGCMAVQSVLPVAAEEDIVLIEPETYQSEETETPGFSDTEDSGFVTDIEVSPVQETTGSGQNASPEEDISSDTDSETPAPSVSANSGAIEGSEAIGEPDITGEPETIKESETTLASESVDVSETVSESETIDEPETIGASETSNEPETIGASEISDEPALTENASTPVPDEENTEIPQLGDDNDILPEILLSSEEPFLDTAEVVEPENVETEIDTILLGESTATVDSYLNETIDSNLIYDVTDNSVTITGYNYAIEPGKESGVLTIPAEIAGKPVTAIGNSAFRGCTGFTKLSLPDSLTSIGEWAFYNCTGFTGTLSLPGSLTTIGDYAFYGCTGFTGGLSLPDSLTSIGEGAFYGCTGFTGALFLPDSLTTIENSAFCGCTGFIGTLSLPDSLTTIGGGAFSGCTGFTGALSLPDSLTSIGAYAFDGCTGFTGALSLPDSLTSIDEWVFSGCTGLTGTLTIPANATIAKNAFFDNIYINKRYEFGVELWTEEKKTFVAYGDDNWILDNASPSTITWSSSNSNVAKVDKGVVTAVSAGDATITATAYNGQTCTVKIRVMAKQASGYDTQAPVVNRISFQQSITKPGVLTLSMNITEENTGLVLVNGYFYCEDNSSRYIDFYADWSSSPKFSGTHQIDVPVSSKRASGKYYLGNLYLEDENGNTRQYTYTENQTDPWGNPLGYSQWTDMTSGFYDVDIDVNNGSNSLTVMDEFNVDLHASITNSSITSQLNSLPEGTTAMINFNNNNHTIKKEWFEAIKGKDKTIVLSNDGIQWIFNGKTVTTSKDVDCLVDITQEYFSEYGGTKNSLKIVFASNGTLPGPATVRLKSDYLSNIYQISQQLFLYYIKEDASLQQEGNATYILDGEDHWCELSLTHNSSFIVSGQKLSLTQTPASSGSDQTVSTPGSDQTPPAAASSTVLSVELNKSSVGIPKGKSVTLAATVTPDSAVNKNLEWTSSNNNVATVDNNGTVTGKSFGTAIITATSTDGTGKTATCAVTVGYGITYKLNGGVNSEQNPSAYYKQKITLKKPTRKNYIFVGWYTDKKCQNKISKITKKNKKNLTLYAKWKKVTPKKVTVSSLKNSKGGKAVLKFKKLSGAAGYEILYGTNKKLKTMRQRLPQRKLP